MKRTRERGDGLLISIGVFKLVKCVLLTLAGIEALRIANTNAAHVFNSIDATLHFDPDNYYIHRLLGLITPMSEKRLRLLGVGSFVYAALFSIEGTGLVMRKLWAEYLTVVITSTFIPFEAIELAKRFTATRVILLVLNVAIVIYLAIRIRQTRRNA